MRPRGVPRKNLTWSFVIERAAVGRKRKKRVGRVPRVVGLLEQAVEFQRLLDSGEVRFRAGLARRAGVSAAGDADPGVAEAGAGAPGVCARAGAEDAGAAGDGEGAAGADPRRSGRSDHKGDP